MKRFKPLWIITCAILFIGGAALATWYHFNYPEEVANLINVALAVVATFSSFVAIMIADLRLSPIKTKLGVWSPSNETVDNDKQIVVFKLRNKSKRVIDNLVIRMNIPTDLNLYFDGDGNTSAAEAHNQAKTTILTFKQFEYLDSEGEHSNLEIRLGLKLENWKDDRVIYLSVLGKNMSSQRFKIGNDAVNEINSANAAMPFKIAPIK